MKSLNDNKRPSSTVGDKDTPRMRSSMSSSKTWAVVQRNSGDIYTAEMHACTYDRKVPFPPTVPKRMRLAYDVTLSPDPLALGGRLFYYLGVPNSLAPCTRHMCIIPASHSKIRLKNRRRLDLELPDLAETTLGVPEYDSCRDSDSLSEAPLMVLVIDAAEDTTGLLPEVLESDGVNMMDDLVEDVAMVDPAIS